MNVLALALAASLNVCAGSPADERLAAAAFHGYYAELEGALDRAARKAGRKTAVHVDVEDAVDELPDAAFKSRLDLEALALAAQRRAEAKAAAAARAEGLTVEDYLAKHDLEVWSRLEADAAAGQAALPQAKPEAAFMTLLDLRARLGVKRVRPYESRWHQASRDFERLAAATFKRFGLVQIQASLPQPGDEDAWNYLFGDSRD